MSNTICLFEYENRKIEVHVEYSAEHIMDLIEQALYHQGKEILKLFDERTKSYYVFPYGILVNSIIEIIE